MPFPRVPRADELLAISDPSALRNAVVAYVAAKRDASGPDSLTPFERVIEKASYFEFKETQETLLEDAMDAAICADTVGVLEEIGAYQMARALRAARALYAAVPPEHAATARTNGDWWALVGEARLDAIHASLIEEEIADRLTHYIDEHRGRLRSE